MLLCEENIRKKILAPNHGRRLYQGRVCLVKALGKPCGRQHFERGISSFESLRDQ